MKPKVNKKHYKQIALALSLCAIILWAILGTGASLAWFTDSSEKVTNIFHFADFDLEVSHRLEDGTWEKVDGDTKLFDENALYEPGYVQVVYLRIDNVGEVPFDFHTAVSVTDYTVAKNVFGQQFQLQEYLRFGVAIADTEQAMDEKVETRSRANEIATTKLSTYSTDVAALKPGESSYMALVVRMPQEVDNEANYRGDKIPRVDLGIIVKADQQNKS